MNSQHHFDIGAWCWYTLLAATPLLQYIFAALKKTNKFTKHTASTFAVHGFTEAARHDLAGTPIRETHIAPGMVGNTELSNLRLGDEKAAAVYENIVPLHPDDVADTVIYAVSLLFAQIFLLTKRL